MAIFSNICTAQAQRLFMNFRCKFRHRRSIPRPWFPIRLQNFGDLATFSVDYCILYSECPPYFYFRFLLPTDLESIPHASTPTLIIPTKFEVGMCIHCRVIVFLSADTSRDLDLWPLDLEQLQCMAGHVTNLATKLEDPTPIRSWFMRYNVSHWLPLKMRARPLRMRRITWPVSRVSLSKIHWNRRLRPILKEPVMVLLGTSRKFTDVTTWSQFRQRKAAALKSCLSVSQLYFCISVDFDNYIFGIPDPDLPIHYTTFIGLRRRYSPWLCKFLVRDLDLEQLSFMASHVTNLATKYEDPTPIRSWVTSYNGSHWLVLEMRTQPLRMRQITWPVSRGSKIITYLESPTPICLFTIQLLLGYDDD